MIQDRNQTIQNTKKDIHKNLHNRHILKLWVDVWLPMRQISTKTKRQSSEQIQVNVWTFKQYSDFMTLT